VPSFDPEGTWAILIGVSHFSADPAQYPALPAVQNNIRDFANILTNPNIVGLKPGHVATVLDPVIRDDMTVKLVDVCRRATDALIVYFAGHGAVGKNTPTLYLIPSGARDEFLEQQSVSFDEVRNAIRESAAPKKLLIFDCCFSGRALDHMGEDDSFVRANMDVRGTFTIASAPANQPAIAPVGDKYTLFTGELINTLSGGLNNGREELTLEDVFNTVRTTLRARPGAPEPQAVNFRDAQHMFVARNIRFRQELEARLTDRMREQEGRISARVADLEGRLSSVAQDVINLRSAVEQVTDGLSSNGLDADAGSLRTSTVALSDADAEVRRAGAHSWNTFRLYLMVLIVLGPWTFAAVVAWFTPPTDSAPAVWWQVTLVFGGVYALAIVGAVFDAIMQPRRGLTVIIFGDQLSPLRVVRCAGLGLLLLALFSLWMIGGGAPMVEGHAWLTS
jgi:hypothetical protein